MPTTLPLRTPCCNRKVQPCAFYSAATEVVNRRCPKCKTAYVVKAEVRSTDGHMWLHELTWTPKQPQRQNPKPAKYLRSCHTCRGRGNPWVVRASGRPCDPRCFGSTTPPKCGCRCHGEGHQQPGAVEWLDKEEADERAAIAAEQRHSASTRGARGRFSKKMRSARQAWEHTHRPPPPGAKGVQLYRRIEGTMHRWTGTDWVQHQKGTAAAAPSASAPKQKRRRDRSRRELLQAVVEAGGLRPEAWKAILGKGNYGLVLRSMPGLVSKTTKLRAEDLASSLRQDGFDVALYPGDRGEDISDLLYERVTSGNRVYATTKAFTADELERLRAEMHPEPPRAPNPKRRRATVDRLLKSRSWRGPLAAALLAGCLAGRVDRRRNPMDQRTYDLIANTIRATGRVHDEERIHEAALTILTRYHDAPEAQLRKLASMAARWFADRGKGQGRLPHQTQLGKGRDALSRPGTLRGAQLPEEIEIEDLFRARDTESAGMSDIASKVEETLQRMPAGQAKALRDWIARRIAGTLTKGGSRSGTEGKRTAAERAAVHRALPVLRRALKHLVEGYSEQEEATEPSEKLTGADLQKKLGKHRRKNPRRPYRAGAMMARLWHEENDADYWPLLAEALAHDYYNVLAMSAAGQREYDFGVGPRLPMGEAIPRIIQWVSDAREAARLTAPGLDEMLSSFFLQTVADLTRLHGAPGTYGRRMHDRRNPLLLTNPVSPQALAAFHKFHGRDTPPKVRPITGKRDLVRLGELHEVVYQPKKGERRGPAFFHRFGRGAVLAATVDGRDLVLIPNRRRPFRVDWERGIVG